MKKSVKTEGMRSFYKAAVESILTFGITVCYGHLTAEEGIMCDWINAQLPKSWGIKKLLLEIFEYRINGKVL